MSTEFIKIGPNMARSAQGFTVVFHPPAGVDYSDASGSKIRIDTELYVGPLRHVLYAKSKDLRGVTSPRADEILANIQRAMEYLGHPAEISKE
jgi:hypothetical protein